VLPVRRTPAAADGVRQHVSSLSHRERDVLALSTQGRTSSAIAFTLHLGEKAMENLVAGSCTQLDLLAEPDDSRQSSPSSSGCKKQH